MEPEVFRSSEHGLDERNLTIVELITAAESLLSAGEIGSAAALYGRWINHNTVNDHLPPALFNHATLLLQSGDLAGAQADFERAIVLNPSFLPAYVGLANASEAMGDVGRALTQWSALSDRLAMVTRKALDHKLTALNQMSRILVASVHGANAESSLRQSIVLAPDQPEVLQSFIALRLAQCQWPVVAPWDGVSKKALVKGIGPLSTAVYSDDPLLQLASAWNYEKGDIDERAARFPENRRPHADDFAPRRRRIGYLSSDLRNHAVGAMMAEFFEWHDRREFEIFAYYCGVPGEDGLQARIKPTIEHWIDIGNLSDDAAARRIAEDGIDILVDLNGHTRAARTQVFARRPAPVIANWLGYPGSMGTPYHHYIIADDWIIPQGHELYYSEKVLRLPCYQPNDRKRTTTPYRPSRQELGLPEHGTVFCCFNDVHKIIRFTFERWMTILQRVPDSVLWLLRGSDTACKNLRDHAAACGIAPERLIFADVVPHSDHLARCPVADLFLDTSPYGAHVTASDALWAGLPILTVSGRSFASRVCGSLCRAAGMAELVCATPEEYIERAVAIGNDRTEIARLKAILAAGRDSCTLFAVDQLVHHLEGLYRQMWSDFLQERLPRPDLANLDVYLEVGCGIDHEASELLGVPDYHGLYRSRMARRHRYYPIGEDRRLWTAADIAEWTGERGKAEASGNNVYPFARAGGR